MKPMVLVSKPERPIAMRNNQQSLMPKKMVIIMLINKIILERKLVSQKMTKLNQKRRSAKNHRSLILKKMVTMKHPLEKQPMKSIAKNKNQKRIRTSKNMRPMKMAMVSLILKTREMHMSHQNLKS